MPTAGYTSIGASTLAMGTNDVNNPQALLVTFTEIDILSKITAYVRSTVSTANMVCRIYSGSAGSRGSLLVTTNTGSVTTTAAWIDFTLSAPFDVTATTYWLEFVGDGAHGPGGNRSEIQYDAGGAANTSYGLSDLGSPIYGTNQYSIYATYTVAGSPLEVVSRRIY